MKCGAGACAASRLRCRRGAGAGAGPRGVHLRCITSSVGVPSPLSSASNQGSSQKKTRRSRAARVSRCCGRWVTKCQRRWLKQRRSSGLDSGTNVSLVSAESAVESCESMRQRSASRQKFEDGSFGAKTGRFVCADGNLRCKFPRRRMRLGRDASLKFHATGALTAITLCSGSEPKIGSCPGSTLIYAYDA